MQNPDESEQSGFYGQPSSGFVGNNAFAAGPVAAGSSGGAVDAMQGQGYSANSESPDVILRNFESELQALLDRRPAVSNAELDAFVMDVKSRSPGVEGRVQQQADAQRGAEFANIGAPDRSGNNRGQAQASDTTLMEGVFGLAVADAPYDDGVVRTGPEYTMGNSAVLALLTQHGGPMPDDTPNRPTLGRSITI